MADGLSRCKSERKTKTRAQKTHQTVPRPTFHITHTHTHTHTHTNSKVHSPSHTHIRSFIHSHTNKLFADVASFQWGSRRDTHQPAVTLCLVVLSSEPRLGETATYRDVHTLNSSTSHCTSLTDIIWEIWLKATDRTSHLKCLIERVEFEVFWMGGHRKIKICWLSVSMCTMATIYI